MGWLMGWSCDAQEAFDNHLIAYRIGEDPRVLLPQMVCQDGFFVSHITGDVDLPDPSQVKEFLPPYKHPYPSIRGIRCRMAPRSCPSKVRRFSWSVLAPWKTRWQ
jgi:pyruvate/2-oxoacid:ferredoxin oxidoreductase alpha subunit